MIADVKFALRQLLKSPGYTALAVIALALGIGANTAIFSAINTLFLRPLRFEDPSRLVRVWTNLSARGLNQASVSYPRYRMLAAGQEACSVAAFSFTGLTRTGQGDPATLNALRITQNLFPLLGVHPVAGRNFLAQEDTEGGAPAVLLSYRYWQKQFGGADTALGSVMILDGAPYTIVGVLPASLEFPFDGQDIFLPRVFDQEGIPQDVIEKGSGYLQCVARMKPGVTIAQANQQFQVLSDRYAKAFPDKVDAQAPSFCLSLHEDLVGQQRPLFLVLLATVGFVLVIACANVANLLLARFTGRRKEIAIRSALGARRRQIVRQFMAESVLTALVAGALGILVALWGMELLARIEAGSGNAIPRLEELALDPWVLAFAMGAALLTGCGMGLVPALQASQPDASEALKESSRGSTGGRSVGRFRASLLITEVALSLVLLVGAGLLLDSFGRLQHTATGFNPDHAAIVNLALPASSYPDPHRTWVVERALAEKLTAVPGVTAAGGTTGLPLGGNYAFAPYAVEGRPMPDVSSRALAARPVITPGYLQAIGVPLKLGRDFTWADDATARNVLLINESLARKLFPHESPLGHRLITGIMTTPREIVGVVGDVRSQQLDLPPPDEMYYPVAQTPIAGFITMVVRSDRPARSLRADVTSAVHAIDATIPIADVQPVAEILSQSIAAKQLAMALLSGFAGLALLLAGMGIYTVIAYAVAQRTNEFGIRMALGASPRDVFVLVVGQGMRLALMGLVIGLGATFALAHLMDKLLYEVQAYDPTILAAVSIFLAGVAALACAIPAWRAVRLDPLTALRSD